jgi:hypothetical protein
MKSIYRYRKERRFAQPPEAIWPFVADSARINEIAGMPAYKVEERADADGRIERLASIKYGPIRAQWKEQVGEWQENRWLTQTRHFINGPFGRFVASAEVHPDGWEAAWCSPPSSSASACWDCWRNSPGRSGAKATSASAPSSG